MTRNARFEYLKGQMQKNNFFAFVCYSQMSFAVLLYGAFQMFWSIKVGHYITLKAYTVKV